MIGDGGVHFISAEDINKELLNSLIVQANDIIMQPIKYSKVMTGKQLASLFFEPSTRTRLSFESAMLGLGGSIIGFSSPDVSSVTKGESLADTIRTISCYADLCVIRHPKDGSALVACNNSSIPVINAGDGIQEHPTQTLTDLFTIHSELGRLDSLTIGLCGDLKFGRTVHSLVQTVSMFDNINFIFVSPKELRMPDYILQDLTAKQIPYIEIDILDTTIHEMDVLYMTRVQKERFFNEEEYLRLKDVYILDNTKLKTAKENLKILHPLPRVNEINIEVDDTKYCCYFKQAYYGKYIRMALILHLMEGK